MFWYIIHLHEKKVRSFFQCNLTLLNVYLHLFKILIIFYIDIFSTWYEAYVVIFYSGFMSKETRVLHVMYVYHETPHTQQNWSKRQWIWIETIDTIRSNSVIILATVSIVLNINCKDACSQHLYFWDSEIVCDKGMCNEQ